MQAQLTDVSNWLLCCCLCIDGALKRLERDLYEINPRKSPHHMPTFGIIKKIYHL